MATEENDARSQENRIGISLFLTKTTQGHCLGRYTIAVYSLIDDSTDERHLQNARSIHSPFIR